jgi:ADP-heptose:LPS heptosyltransferase
MQHIISADQLRDMQEILFIIDLSLKDFLFIQSYLAKFAELYPKIKIDLWINSRCRCLFGHKPNLEEKLFVELLQECTFINKTYFNTCSRKLLKQNVQQACESKYQLVVILANKNLYYNIKLAKRLNPDSFLIGPNLNTKWYNFFKHSQYKRLNSKIDCNFASLKDLYKSIFVQLLGESVVAHKAELVIPRKWITYAKLKFLKWGIDKRGQRFGKVFFINAFSDNEDNVWQLKSVLSVIKSLKKNDEWGDINFALHVPPNKLKTVRNFFAKYSVNNLFLFSADHNFFQIPSILSLCDGIASVDGFISELAGLLNVQALPKGVDEHIFKRT